jgi:hypothetical protein
MRRTPLAAAIVVLSLTVVVGSPAADEPMPLRGVALGGDTGLRLVVADNPPFVLNVDTGGVREVTGIPAIARGTVEVVAVAGRAAVVVLRSARDAKLYAVRGRGARTSYLGTGRNATPAADGRSAWIQSRVGPSRCTLRQVGLDGRQLRAPRPFPCGTRSDPSGGSVGVVVNRTRVLDPVTGRTVLVTRWGVLAAVGRRLVLAGPGRQLALLDAATGAERRLRWPSTLPGLDQPAVDPRGRLVAVAFATPWNGWGQVLDVWLLDAVTGRLTHLPAMPAYVALKPTSMTWTADGRLVLLGEHDQEAFVAVWRPGERRLALKTVRPPQRTGSFAPLG